MAPACTAARRTAMPARGVASDAIVIGREHVG